MKSFLRRPRGRCIATGTRYEKTGFANSHRDICKQYKRDDEKEYIKRLQKSNGR